MLRTLRTALLLETKHKAIKHGYGMVQQGLTTHSTHYIILQTSFPAISLDLCKCSIPNQSLADTSKTKIN